MGANYRARHDDPARSQRRDSRHDGPHTTRDRRRGASRHRWCDRPSGAHRHIADDGRRGCRYLGNAGAAGTRERAPPPLPVADEGHAWSAGRRALRLAADVVPDLGPAHARGHRHRDARRSPRVGAQRLHHCLRPSIPVAQCIIGRRPGRGRSPDRDAIPRIARVDVARPERRGGCRRTPWWSGQTTS